VNNQVSRERPLGQDIDKFNARRLGRTGRTDADEPPEQ
jgi:hypothetical protein